MYGDAGEGTREVAKELTAAERKTYPLATGLIDYFPDALMEVAHVSYVGNEQHNPGSPLHWDRSKSTDESDALMRHFAQRGTMDTDGMLHSAKVAWIALAMLQKELEARKTNERFTENGVDRNDTHQDDKEMSVAHYKDYFSPRNKERGL